MNIEIYLSLLNWLYIIKRKSNVFVKYIFYFATHEIKIFSTSLDEIKAIFNKKFEYPLYIVSPPTKILFAFSLIF